MAETLTLSGVIENINHVYGQRLLLAIFALFLLEMIFFIAIKRKVPQFLPKVKRAFVVAAFLLSIALAWRAKPYVAYDKFESAGTVCSARYILNQKDYEDFNWADNNIYKYHYFNKYPEKIIDSDFNTKFGAGTDIPNLDESVLCAETTKEYVIQVIACLLIYITGFLLVKCIFRNRYKILGGFLAVPTGASIIVLGTVFIHFLHIRYNWISYCIFLLLFWISCLCFLKKNKVLWEKTDYILIVIALLAFICSAYAKFYQFSGDSRWQLILAMNLLDEGVFSPWAFAQATTFGFWGISLHAFALLFGADYLYAYFIVINIAGIGIFISSLYLFSRQDDKKEIMLFSFMSIVVLLLNFDFDFYSFSVLSNASMGVVLLSIVVLTILAIDRRTNVTFLLALLSFTLLTTRVEGVCYVALFMAIPFERKGCLKWATIISGIEIILWQIAQFIYSDGTGVDGWTPVIGVALSLLGIVLIIEPYLIKINWISYVSAHYKIIYIFALLAIIVVGFCYDSVMAKDNLAVFLSHLTVSKYSNSLSLWTYLFFLLPISMDSTRKESYLFIVVAYFLLIFGISIFRTGNPLNTELSDSFRRMICQMMIMSTWLISYYAGMSDENNIC